MATIPCKVEAWLFDVDGKEVGRREVKFCHIDDGVLYYTGWEAVPFDVGDANVSMSTVGVVVQPWHLPSQSIRLVEHSTKLSKYGKTVVWYFIKSHLYPKIFAITQNPLLLEIKPQITVCSAMPKPTASPPGPSPVELETNRKIVFANDDEDAP